MALTPNYSLPYQTENDSPDGPDLGEGIATTLDALLDRARPVANAAARTAIAGSALYEGLIVAQNDDYSGWIYLVGAWRQIWAIGLGGGGGGGGTTSSVEIAAYSATATQTLANATDTPLAFGVGADSASIVRSTKGVGHKFTLQPGTYSISACCRFAAGSTGSRFIGLRKDDESAQYISAQNDGGPSAATRNFSTTVPLNSATALYVAASQSSGSSLATQTTGSPTTTGYVSLVIARIG